MTVVDRASRFNLIGELSGDHGAENMLACCIELFERVPAQLRRSLTWDQGREMARHEGLTAAVGIDVYFADAHSRGNVPPMSISTDSFVVTSARPPTSRSTPKTTLT